MAKKSARSKGFRKSSGKKPYLSKRDIIILCVILAVIAIGAILLFSYDDGALKTKGGEIADKGDNWLIVNGSTSGGRRYYKVGEVEDLAGYTLAAEAILTDANLSQYRYTPDSEDSAIRSIVVSASPSSPDRLAAYYASFYGAIDSLELSETGTDAVDGRAYTYYTYTHEYASDDDSVDDASIGDASVEDAAETNGAGSNRFEQAINAYFEAPHDRCVLVNVIADAEDSGSYLSEDELKEIAAQVASAIRFEG